MEISPVYQNKGISRYDRHYHHYRCCHCDGLVLLTMLDVNDMQQRLEKNPQQEAQSVAESGLGYLYAYRQYLHNRCGVYLGPNRSMDTRDLDFIAGKAILSDQEKEQLCLHYKVDTESLQTRAIHLQKSEEDYKKFNRKLVEYKSLYQREDLTVEEVALRHGRLYQIKKYLKEFGLAFVGIQICQFSIEDIDKIHSRIYVSEADMALINSRNLNKTVLPPLNRADVVPTTIYTADELWHLHPVCFYCEALVTARWPGIRYNVDEKEVFIHNTCYDKIRAIQMANARQEMIAFFDSKEHKRRLSQIISQYRLPLQEYLTWRSSFDASQLDAYAAEAQKESFLNFWETRLQIMV